MATYEERESWIGTTVILAWERDEKAEPPQYRVLEVSHGHGSYRLHNLTTGKDVGPWAHMAQLVEVDGDGNEVRGCYMTDGRHVAAHANHF